MDIRTIKNPGCVDAAVIILGDKWTPRIVRSLSEGPMRFCRIQDAVGGVNPRTLSARLHSLEKEGIVTKRVYPTSPPHTDYTLTEKGYDLIPILRSMAKWSEQHAGS